MIITRITQAGLELLRGLDRPIEEFNRQADGAFERASSCGALIKLLEAVREQEG